MKVGYEYIKSLIKEMLRLNKDGDVEEVGPKKEIDAIYHDSTRDDNINGYTSMNKKRLKVKFLKQKGDEVETTEVD